VAPFFYLKEFKIVEFDSMI